MRIFQLNVEGLSAAKRSVISALAVKHNVDVICLQETHVGVNIAERFDIDGFDLVRLHPARKTWSSDVRATERHRYNAH